MARRRHKAISRRCNDVMYGRFTNRPYKITLLTRFVGYHIDVIPCVNARLAAEI